MTDKRLCLNCTFYEEGTILGYWYTISNYGRKWVETHTYHKCHRYTKAIRTIREECKGYIPKQQLTFKGGELGQMSVFDELNKVKNQTLSSELPDKITATVIKASKTVKTGKYEGTPMLQLILRLKDGTETSTNYRIPKAWTGKGQMDILINSLKKLKIDIKDIEGKTFEWERMELEGSVKGNARHYPVKVIK